MGAKLGGKGMLSEINMTLIDIVLVVLIIMMVNIPIQIEEMGLKLPAPNPPPPPPDTPQDQLVIAIYEDATVALNRRAMAEDKMVFELGRRLRSMTAKNVFIDADELVTYGRVVDMVDLARQAGAANVGLAKLKPEGPLPPNSVDSGAGIPRGIYFGSPLVVGEMTEKQADAAIQPLKGAITQAYFQRLAMRPELTGSFSIYVQIGPQGEHLEPPLIETDTVQDLELRDLVTPIPPTMRFQPLGKPQATAGIRYNILFSPGG